MRQLFVDTSAYFALTDKRDGNLEAPAHFVHQLIREGAELLTTNYVVAETHTLLLNRILTQAFAFDHHFAQYGFSLLPAMGGTFKLFQ